MKIRNELLILKLFLVMIIAIGGEILFIQNCTVCIEINNNRICEYVNFAKPSSALLFFFYCMQFIIVENKFCQLKECSIMIWQYIIANFTMFTACQTGTYGKDCLATCSTNCLNQHCNEVSGECFECHTGWQGFNCTQSLFFVFSCW